MNEIVQDIAMIAGGVFAALQCAIWSQAERFDEELPADDESDASDDGDIWAGL